MCEKQQYLNEFSLLHAYVYTCSGLFGTSGMQGNFSAMSTSFTGSSFLPDEDDVRTSSSANAASMTGPMKTATGTPGGSASAASAAGNTSGASAGYVPSMLFQRHGSAATSQVPSLAPHIIFTAL